MTTHVTSHRFKAQDALVFLETLMDDLPADVLNQKVVLQADWDNTLDDSTIYWSRLPPDTSAAWSLYKTPPPTVFDKLLYQIALNRYVERILRYFRRMLRC